VSSVCSVGQLIVHGSPRVSGGVAVTAAVRRRPERHLVRFGSESHGWGRGLDRLPFRLQLAHGWPGEHENTVVRLGAFVFHPRQPTKGGGTLMVPGSKFFSFFPALGGILPPVTIVSWAVRSGSTKPPLFPRCRLTSPLKPMEKQWTSTGPPANPVRAV
jgi:hypothetical protein